MPEDAAKANTPHGMRLVDGAHDHRNRRYDDATDSVVPYKPPAPSPDHDWSEMSETWVLRPEVAARQEARHAALAGLLSLDVAQLRAIEEHILGITPDLGQPTAAERLAAIHAAKVELRKKL